MIFSVLTAATSTVIIDSILAGTTLATTIFCCGKNIKKPTASRRK